MKKQATEKFIDETEFLNYFTFERVLKIKNKDSVTILQAFNKYKDFLTRFSINYLSKRNYIAEFSKMSYLEILGQILLDFPYYDFSTSKKFVSSIKYKLLVILDGGYDYLINNKKTYFNSTYKKPIFISIDDNYNSESENEVDGKLSILDICDICEESPEDIFLREEEEKSNRLDKVLIFCRSLLKGKALESFDLALEGYTQSKIKEKIGYCSLAAARKKILAHYNELKKFLDDAGIRVPG